MYGVLRGESDGVLSSFYKKKLALSLCMRPRFWRVGCWKIRFLLKLTWHDAGWWLIVLFVLFVG